MMHYVGNKKRTWRALLAAIAATALLAACGDPATIGGPEGDVDSVAITGPGEVEVNDTIQLTATVEADPGVSQAVEWESSNPALASVNASGVVSGLEVGGPVTITATSRANNAVRATHAVTVVAEGTGGGGGDGGGGGGGGDLDFVVTSAEDYDPYALQGWDPEEPIEGTLRYVLENAPAGSRIGFADGIDRIVVNGVDTVNLGTVDEPQHVDSHLIFRNDVTLVGPITIEGGSAYEEGDPGDPFTYESRVMYVTAGATVTLENVDVTGGDFIFWGGGIRNDGTLTIRDGVVYGNRAWDLGGGIYNHDGAELTLIDTTVRDNEAFTTADEYGETYPIRGGSEIGPMNTSGWGGGLYIRPGGTVTVQNSTISDNRALASGGGIYNFDADVTMTGSTISGNVTSEAFENVDLAACREEGSGGTTTDTCPNYGGGVYTDGSFSFSGGSFVNNEADQSQGGGLFLNASGTATLADTSFDSNSAEFGGGILHRWSGDMGNLTPTDPTAPGSSIEFTGNTATTGDDYYDMEVPTSSLMSLHSLRSDEGISGRDR